MKNEHVTVGPCCFCGAHIAPTDIDPCRITVQTAANRWQIWYCHGLCFDSRLTLPVGRGALEMERR